MGLGGLQKVISEDEAKLVMVFGDTAIYLIVSWNLWLSNEADQEGY